MILEEFPNVQELSREEKLQLAAELWEETIPLPDEAQAAAIQSLVECRMKAWKEDPGEGASLEEFNKRFSLLRRHE